MKYHKILSAVIFLIAIMGNEVYADANTAITCSEAASVLVERVNTQTNKQGVSKSYSSNDIYWTSERGHEGICHVDEYGRVYEVKVTRFPMRQDNGASYSLVCSSNKYRRQVCDLRGLGSVEIERQISQSRCTRGDTWGVDRSAIWVEGGCSARFRVTPVPLWSAYTVMCSSRDSALKNCRIKPDAKVSLQKQKSNSVCREGHSWGQDDDLIWVDKGCRGLFEVRPAVDYQNTGNNDSRQAINRCEEEARRNQFMVYGAKVITHNHSRYDVEIDAKRGRVQMYLQCRYNAETGSAYLEKQ